MVIAPALKSALGGLHTHIDYIAFVAVGTVGLLVPLTSLFAGLSVIVDRTVGALYETRRGDEEKYPEFAKRRTYVIDPEGIIRKAYRVKDIPAHPGQVLEDLRNLLGSSA